jgi:hypothetical protein
MRTTAGGLGLVAALILGACGTGPQASTTAGASTSALPTGSPQAMASLGIASPTPRPATPQPTEPFAIGTRELAPGRYLQAGFAPGVQFVLGSGWKGYFDDYDGAYLGGPDGLEIGINKPPKVIDPKTGKPIETPADLAAWLATNPVFDSVTSTTPTIGGLRTTLVDATAHGDRALLAYDSGNFHTLEGFRYRFYVFPMPGPDLLFMVMGPATKFEAQLPLIEEIVKSIHIGRH